MKLSILIGLLFAIISCKTEVEQPSTIIYDVDGNAYQVVIIGNQRWCTSNLRTTHYNNGIAIPRLYDPSQIKSATSGVYMIYDNDETVGAKYGYIYNWKTIMTGYLCPKGWHIATEDEWESLVHALGGEEQAARSMRNHQEWDGLMVGDNSSGFNALPGGVVLYDNFHGLNTDGVWFTSTPKGVSKATCMVLESDENEVEFYDYNQSEYGAYCRCMRRN
jgi:uncharacterized protein (TIGR02145 family)